MTRVLVPVLVAATLFCAVLTGCGSTAQTGTFEGYDLVKSADQTNMFGNESVIPKYEKTGAARVKLDSGTTVKANCPIEDLQRGDKVSVQQNDDGTWVVMGKQ